MGPWTLFLAVLSATAALGHDTYARGKEDSTLNFLQHEALFSFEYSTSAASDTNWVGLYHEAGVGLIDQIDKPYRQEPVVWEYAPGREGVVQLSTDALRPGRYTAFFLANDGFRWLADPVDVFHSPNQASNAISFIVHNSTLPNVRTGEDFSVNIAGLVRKIDHIYVPTSFGSFKKDAGIKFWKGSGPPWLYVSKEGELFGHAEDRSYEGREITVLVWAIQGKAITSMNFRIAFRPRNGPLLDKLRVMTFNTWLAGTKVRGAHEKQVRFLLDSGADIVGLQEVHGLQDSTRLLAEALGWHYWSCGDGCSTGILSKYPLEAHYEQTGRSGGVLVSLDGVRQQVWFWVAHLSPHPYGPYKYCFPNNWTPQEKLSNENGRAKEIAETISLMHDALQDADDVPVILTGDFNTPSHLDWVEGAEALHCGHSGIEWPVSKHVMEVGGMHDSFRVAHPSPVDVPGFTYDVVMPWNDDEDLPEPQDRIDFVYHKGEKLEVLESSTVVRGLVNDMPDHEFNTWTSDHAAVLTVYKWRDGWHDDGPSQNELRSVEE